MGDIFAWRSVPFSGKRHWDFDRIWPFFPLAQEQRGVKGHKKVGGKSSVNWMGEEKYGSGSSVVSEDSHGVLFETHPQDLLDQRAEDVK